MPWSAGTFSRANGATGWQDDQAANIGIEAGRHDTQDNDFRNGINETINKAGQNTPTGNLPMGGFKHTGVANAAASAEYAAYGQVQAGVNVQSTALDWTATQYSNDTTAAKFVLQKSRGATTGSNVIVNNGDAIGSLEFRGNNGTTFTNAASIAAAVDGAPGASNDMPGRLVFSTSADASGTPTERMRIDSTGKVGIGASPAYDLDLDKTVNGDVLTHIYNRSNGTSARSGILLGSDFNTASASITLNSTTYTGAGGGTANDLVINNAAGAGDIYFRAGAANRMIIADTGIVTMGAYGAGTATFSAAGVISSTSDERLKIKDGPVTNAKDKINTLVPGYWYWKPEVASAFGPQRELGFFAQNVNQAIGPEAAPEPNGEKAWGYYDRSVLAVSVQALKDLFATIDALEARVAALEGA